MSQDPIVLVRGWFEGVWNQRRIQTIDELLASDSVCHADDGTITGPEEFKERQYMPFVTMFPDIHIEVEAALAQDDQVVVRWIATGTHTGDAMGMSATGGAVSFRGMTWVRVRDGKMIEEWQSTNIPEVMRS